MCEFMTKGPVSALKYNFDFEKKAIVAVGRRNVPSLALWPHLSYNICIDTIY